MNHIAACHDFITPALVNGAKCLHRLGSKVYSYTAGFALAHMLPYPTGQQTRPHPPAQQTVHVKPQVRHVVNMQEED